MNNLPYLYLFGLLAGLYVRMRARAPSRLGKIPVLSWNQLAFLSGGSRRLTEITLYQLVAGGVLEFNNDKGTLSVVESLTQELPELENLVVCLVRQKPRLEACYTWLERNIKNSLIAQDTIKSLISCSLIVDSQVINLKTNIAVMSIGFLVLIMLLNLLSIIIGWPMNAVKKIIMGIVIEFAIGPALVFSLPILLLGERTRWGDHVLFTYKQRLSTNDQRMAMAVGGLEAMENKSLLEFCNLIKKIQSDMEDSG